MSHSTTPSTEHVATTAPTAPLPAHTVSSTDDDEPSDTETHIRLSLARTTTPMSTTTTLYHSGPASTQDAPTSTPTPAPTAPPIPPPDIISFFDPASAGGGGPLVRIATQHSARSLARERSRSGSTAVRPTLVPLTRCTTTSGRRGSSNTNGNGRPEAIAGSPTDEKFTAVFIEDDILNAGPKDTGSPAIHERVMVQKTHSGPSHDGEKGTLVLDVTASTPAKAEAGQAEVDEVDINIEAHVYPDGGYGWVVVACCTTLCALTNGWGMNYGVFQQYYAEYTFPTADTSVLSLAGTCQGFFLGATSFISGRMGDRFGFKRVMIIGAIVSWLGLFCCSFSKALWSTILCQGVITGIGQGIAFPLFMSLPSQWFYKKRGLASGIAMGGAGLGGGVSTLVVRKLLTAVGASKTLLIMSFVNLAGMLVSIALIRTRPTSPEASHGRGSLINVAAFKHSEFWSIAMSLVVGILGYGVPFTFLTQWVALHFPDASTMGMTAPLTILSFSVIVGRGLVGLAADKVGALNTYICVLVLSGVIQLSLWLTAKSYASVCVFGVMYGLVAPGYLGILPQIVVTLFGPAELASNVGLLLLFNSPGNLVAGPMGGAIYDATGRTTFKYMIITMGALQIVGGLIACWARFRTSPSLLARV